MIPGAASRIRGIAVTGRVLTDAEMLSRFPKIEIISSFGVGYDHIDTVRQRARHRRLQYARYLDGRGRGRGARLAHRHGARIHQG